MAKLRVVIDTNVVFEGLTRGDSAAGLLIDAWMAGLLDVCVSGSLVYEYGDVLSRKLSAARWEHVQQALAALLTQTEFVSVYFSWRPISPHAADDHVIDCAMNAGAIVVTHNLRDFGSAREELGLRVVTPAQAVALLVGEGESQ